MGAGAFVNIEFVNEHEMLAMLGMVPTKVANDIQRKILRAATKLLKPIAESRIPVHTGRLKKAGLNVRRQPGLKRGDIGFELQTPTRAKLGISPEDKGYYPAHLELGHKTASGGQVAARSYLRSTADEMRPRVIAYARRRIIDAVKRAMR